LIVVSDTSPLLNLAAVGRVSLLNQLYGDVLIPPIVAQELVRNGVDLKAGWVKVEAPKDAAAVRALLEVLDPGESEAIVLAEERSAGLLLIDERRGWRIAVKKGIPSTGLLGVLAEAKKRGLIGMSRPILDDMTRLAGFWVGQDLRSKYLSSLGE
jgi:uncharacterized protein